MTQRAERVAGLLIRETSRVIHEELRNPRIGFVTFLRVEVTPDLRLAKVFYSVLGSEADQARTGRELGKSARYIQHLVNKRVELRYAIELRFIRESSVEQSFKIERILDRIRREREGKRIGDV